MQKLAVKTAQPVNTETAITLVRNFLKCSIAEICRARRLFEPESFQACTVAGRKRTTFANTCPDAKPTVECLERGVFSAISTRRLKDLSVVVLAADRITILETYVFGLTYNGATVQVKTPGTTRTATVTSGNAMANFGSSVTALVDLLERMPPLERGSCFTFHLGYYEDRIEPGYHPDGFFQPDDAAADLMEASINNSRQLNAGLDTGVMTVALSMSRPNTIDDPYAGESQVSPSQLSPLEPPVAPDQANAVPMPIGHGPRPVDADASAAEHDDRADNTQEAAAAAAAATTTDAPTEDTTKTCPQRILVPALAVWFFGCSAAGRVTVSDVRNCPIVPGAGKVSLSERQQAMKYLVKRNFLVGPQKGGVYAVIRDATNARRVLQLLSKPDMAPMLTLSDAAKAATTEIAHVATKVSDMPTETMPSQLPTDGASPPLPTDAAAASPLDVPEDEPPAGSVTPAEGRTEHHNPVKAKGKRRVLFAGSP